MNPKHLETIDRAEMLFLIETAFDANTNIGIVSSPGFGKTTIAQRIAVERNLLPISLILPAMDGADIGGVGVLVDGEFIREPLKLLKLATTRPCLIIWEEATCANQDVQAAMLDPLFSRRIADGTPFDPGTRQIVLFNPENEAPNASPLALSLSQRFGCFHLVPAVAEIVEYFAGVGPYAEIMGGEDSDDPARDWFSKWSAHAAHAPELIQLVPPEAAINEGARCGLPRNWEYALRNATAAEAKLDAAKVAADDVKRRRLIMLALASFVGPALATSFLGKLALEEKFPSVDAIVKSPDKADLPEDRATQIGVLGLLHSIARKDSWAAWIYTARCLPEIAAAATVGLGARTKVPARSPHAKAGAKARNGLLGKTGNRMGRRNS
jgi:hypothetical protein